jgi:hypothetical protein
MTLPDSLQNKPEDKGVPRCLGCGYRIEPLEKESSRLHISVRGLWTAKIILRWLAWCWLKWVMRQIVTSVENEMLAYRVWRSKREVETEV